MSVQLHAAAGTHGVETKASLEWVTNGKFPLSIETSLAVQVKFHTHSVSN
jgi:hypothetical protein